MNPNLENISGVGKPEWHEMLQYVARLHMKSTMPPQPPFTREWENIGPGYCFGPAFGHWDITHQMLDNMELDPLHVAAQMENLWSLQLENGMLPSIVWMNGKNVPTDWKADATHPPVWVFGMDALYAKNSSSTLLARALIVLDRQIAWFESNRKAEDGGFYYTDILNHVWESGVDEGVRFRNVQQGKRSCVDATAHVYNLYRHRANWAELLGQKADDSAGKADALGEFIRGRMFDGETGFFHDIWSVNNPHCRHLAFEGIWPVVVGAASAEQANRVIDENLLNPERFFGAHPIASVALCDPAYEARMWQGPAWNSTTYWAAKGCVQYNRHDAARRLLERALDDSAEKFRDTGAIWEFYDANGGNPLQVQRKPWTSYNTPCSEYLGHNPLIAMAFLWERCKGGERH